ASVAGSDYCILVAEPTPSGLFDMKRALNIIKHFNIKSGILINKFDINTPYCRKIEQFAKKNNIEIIGKLPYDKSFIKALVNMIPVVIENKKLKKSFINIVDKIKIGKI
ncbi:hypothetical protein K8R32_04120, partial [bacterium]|nr:hypothetical protein [bacterium]